MKQMFNNRRDVKILISRKERIPEI